MAYHVLKHIAGITRMTNAQFNEEMAQFGLGAGQQFFMHRIAKYPGLSMAELARMGYYDNCTATRAVKKLVEERQAAGWEFLFLAANIDAAEHSAQLGIKLGRAVDWVPDKRGQKLAFEGVGRVMRCARQVADIDEKIDEELFEVREDFKKRGEQNEK